MYCVIADVVKTDRWVLIEPFDDFGRSNTAIDDIFSMLFEFVEDVQGNHKGAENTKENEEIIDSKLTPLYLSHYRIFFELANLISPKYLRLL